MERFYDFTGGIAPALWKTEFLSLANQYCQKLIPFGDMLHTYETAPASGITFTVHPEYTEVLNLAAASESAFDDCEFVVLAGNPEKRLVTYNDQPLNAFPGTSLTPEQFCSV